MRQKSGHRTGQGPRTAGRDSASGPTQRQLRVGEELRHVLAMVFQRETFTDPELAGVPVTVSEVRVSPDLRNATIFVMPLGGSSAAGVLAGLRRASGFIRGLVGRELTLKFTPRMQFELDQSFDEAARIGALLKSERVARDLSDAASDDAEESDDGSGMRTRDEDGGER